MNDETSSTSTDEQAETEQPTQPAQPLLARIAVRIGGGEVVELVREESGALVDEATGVRFWRDPLTRVVRWARLDPASGGDAEPKPHYGKALSLQGAVRASR
jgi:hypothetical protein